LQKIVRFVLDKMGWRECMSFVAMPSQAALDRITARLLRGCRRISSRPFARRASPEDFLLWETFAKFTPPCVAPTSIGGLRKLGKSVDRRR